jgi:hypothetical protein
MSKQKLNLRKQEARNNEIMDETGIFPIPEQYTHSIKISDTAKGIRLDIHVYATDKETVVAEAFDTYIHARDMAVSHEIPVAPIEIKETNVKK